MLGDGDVDRAIGADEEQPRRLVAPREEREEIEGRGITPVQILENQDQRRLRSQRLDCLRHLSKHSLARGAQQFPLQPVAVRGLEEPRQVREPGGGVLAQERQR